MTPLLVFLITLISTILVLLILQNLTAGERKIEYRIAHSYSVTEPAFERAMGSLLGPPVASGNRVVGLLNGDQIFPPMLRAIRAAQKTITFETYIYWSGAIGREFSDALAERARSGLRVHVLLDWIGSGKLDAEALHSMADAGVEVERYRPLRWYHLSRMNHRTHRKILVIDGRVGFIGGVGIADQWLGNAESSEHWRDTHFQVEGPVVAQLQAAFTDNWLKTRSEVLHGDDYFPSLVPTGQASAQVFKSSPREGSGSARLMFLMSIAAASERLILASAYFVPDDQSVDALVAARLRGVQVDILVPGPMVDHAVTRRASRSRWGKLLEAGIAIYEYQPTMFHCKVMVVDSYWVCVGSANFDDRSFRLNDEANLNVVSRELAADQTRAFREDLSRSRRISLEEWQRRPRREKIIEAIAGLLRSQL